MAISLFFLNCNAPPPGSRTSGCTKQTHEIRNPNLTWQVRQATWSVCSLSDSSSQTLTAQASSTRTQPSLVSVSLMAMGLVFLNCCWLSQCAASEITNVWLYSSSGSGSWKLDCLLKILQLKIKTVKHCGNQVHLQLLVFNFHWNINCLIDWFVSRSIANCYCRGKIRQSTSKVC